MQLVFELERGDADEGGEGGAAGASAPRVWCVDDVLGDAQLAQRLRTEWAAWYGPELAGAAGRIAALLARRQAPPDATRHPPVPAAARHPPAPAMPPRCWVMPLVRRRRRQLAIWRAAAAPAPAAGWVLDVQIYWGATSKPGVPSGSVVWQPCALRESPQHIHAGVGGAAELLLARQLRGGVGLLVVRPSALGAAAFAPPGCPQDG